MEKRDSKNPVMQQTQKIRLYDQFNASINEETGAFKQHTHPVVWKQSYQIIFRNQYNP